MTEFTNFTIKVEDATFGKRKSSSVEPQPKHTEPTIYKPLVRDIVHGSTFDRVFFKTYTYKNSKQRCSGGIIVPMAFLDLMSPAQREEAMTLFEKGLLVVQICSATTYFSKRHTQLKSAKAQHVQADIRQVYLPADIATTESPSKVKHSDAERNMLRKLFVTVVGLSEDDRDQITLPHWVVRALAMVEGQSACVSLPKWPAGLHFYDAKRIEIQPITVNYFKIVEIFAEEPRKLSIALKEAVSRYKVLTQGSQIELLIAGEIMRAKVRLSDPSGQLWLLNNKPSKLTVNIKLTEELEREAYRLYTTLEKCKKDSERLKKEGLDLDIVLRQRGLDFDLMEKMEVDHHARIKRLKDRTVQPYITIENALQELDEELESTEKVLFIEPSRQERNRTSQTQNESVQQVPQEQEQEHLELSIKDVIVRKSNNGASVGSSVPLNNSLDGDLLLTSSRSNLYKPKFIDSNLAKVGGEGTMSRLWPTGKINSGQKQLRAQAFVGDAGGVSPQISGITTIRAAKKVHQDQFLDFPKTTKASNKSRAKRDAVSATARSKMPSHQVAMQKTIHVISPSILRLNSKNCLELTSTSKAGDSKQSVLLSQLTPFRQEEKTSEERPVVQVPEQALVVPMCTANLTVNHQQSIVTASMEESSQPNKEFDFNSQREEKKMSILKIIKGNQDPYDTHQQKKLSMSNLHDRAHSIRNLMKNTAVKSSKNAVTSLGCSPPDIEPATPNTNHQTPYFNQSFNPQNQKHLQQHALVIPAPEMGKINSAILPASAKSPQPKILNNRDLDAVSSNLDTHTERNDEFLKTLQRDKSQAASDSVEKLIAPRVVNASGLVAPSSPDARRFSGSSPSKDDVQSELIAYEVLQNRPVIEAVASLQDVNNEDINKISSTKMSDFLTNQALITNNLTPQVINSSASVPNATIESKHLSRGTLNKSSAQGPISVLANNKIYESNKSVFERLTARQPPESTGGEEFKSVLRIIDSIRPDQYRRFATRFAKFDERFAAHRNRCTKNHQIRQQHIYKLDQTLTDFSNKQRAQSSYGPNRQRSLASQLKHNDRMLLKGVTGSPMPLPGHSLQLPKYALTATAGTSTAEQSTSPMTTFLVIDEQDQSQVRNRSQPEKEVNRKAPHETGQRKKKHAHSLKQSSDGTRNHRVSQSDEQKARQFNTIQDQQPSIQLYKAVTNKKFDAGFADTNIISKQQPRPQRSILNIKTGQLSKLFQRYNKQISEQRLKLEKKVNRASWRSNRVTMKDRTPYRLDLQSLPADNRQVNKSSIIHRDRGARDLKQKKRDATTLCIVQTVDQTTQDVADQGTIGDIQSSQDAEQEQAQQLIDDNSNSYEMLHANSSVNKMHEKASGTPQPLIDRDSVSGLSSQMHARAISPGHSNDSHIRYHQQPRCVSVNKENAYNQSNTFDSIDAGIINQSQVEKGTFSSVGTKVLTSLDQKGFKQVQQSSDLGDIVVHDSQSIDPASQAVIEINVNRMEPQKTDAHYNRAGSMPSDDKHSMPEDKGLIQPRLVSLARMSPTHISKDGRINHDCFPANKVTKRDSSLSRNNGLKERQSVLSNETKKRSEQRATSVVGEFARNNSSLKRDAEDLCNELLRQGKLEVGKILVRKKHRRNQKISKQRAQQMQNQNESPNTETSLHFSGVEREQHKMLMLDEGNQSFMVWPFTSKSQPRAQSKPATCRVKWRIVKQKMVQSPGRTEVDKKIQRFQLSKPNSILSPRRRIKTLNTLCHTNGHINHQTMQGMPLISPTSNNDSKESCLETTQIILSQRSATNK